MISIQFINRPSSYSLHTIFFVQYIKGEVAVGINAGFSAVVTVIAEGVGRGDNDDSSCGDETCEPTALRVGYAFAEEGVAAGCGEVGLVEPFRSRCFVLVGGACGA